MSDEKELTPEGPIGDLDGLPSAKPVPHELEDRIVASLVEQGLLTGRFVRLRQVAYATVAAAAMLVVGFMVGRATTGGSMSNAQGARYAFLLIEGDEFEEDISHSNIYAAWADTLAATGLFVDGEELGEREVVVGDHSRPIDVSTSTIGGFFVLDAPSFEEAVAIAHAHPHVRHRGWISVRPIVRR